MKHDEAVTRYEILRPIAVLSTREDMAKEANLVSWNGRPPVIDIREWSSDHTTMSRGITLTQREVTEFIRGMRKLTREENEK